MNQAPNNLSSDMWAKLLTVLILVFGAFWLQPVLESSRPSSSAKGTEYKAIQEVKARLWQDPFSTLEKKTAQHSLNWFTELVKQEKEKIILAVMVSGSPSIDQVEWRRQMRYAVLSALAQTGYGPEDGEHIGYVNLTSEKFKIDCPQLPEYLPFERYKLSGTDENSQPLLLLWLDEEVFKNKLFDGETLKSPTPFSCIKTIFNKLESPKPILIGPNESTTLQALQAELGKNKDDPKKSDDEWHIYSPFATKAGINIKPGEGLKFTRAIATDDILIKKLINELKRRQISPTIRNKNQRIALVGQWDTDYSRGLIEIFREKLPNLLVKNYMRGLDGRLAGSEEETQNTKKDNEKTKRDNIERPEGDKQIDYLRRLAVELKNKETILLHNCGIKDRLKRACGIRAIGILGNDYYDKLLTLQALRKQFPDAVFFTTDLDAAMMHPADNEYTRNLIVASGFDLTLTIPDHPDPPYKEEDFFHPDKINYSGLDLQKFIPPFRTSYQTAAFYAVQRSLCEHLAFHFKNNNDCEKLKNFPWKKARLFEIGRTKAIPLDRSYLNPDKIKFFSLLFVAVMLFLAAFLLSQRIRNTIYRILHNWHALLYLAVLVTPILLAVFDIKSGGEPFYWLEGVSIWPSELLRLTAALLAIYLTYRAFENLDETNENLRKTFFPRLSKNPCAFPEEFESALPKSSKYHPRTIIGLWHKFFLNANSNQKNEDNASEPSDQAWNKYCNWVWGKTIWPMALVCTLFMMFFIGFPLMLAFGLPNVPARSLIAFRLDPLIILITVFACLILLFSVALITYRTILLAERLAKKTRWPVNALQRYGLVTGIETVQFDDWLNIRLIAKLSDCVGRLVFYPLLPLFLLYISRMRIFDAWSFPLGLVILMALTFAIVFSIAWRLRWVAEDVRHQGLKRLNKTLVRLQGGKNKNELTAQTRLLIEQIRDCQEGAFAPFSRQPLIHVLLIVIGGISGISVAEYFTFKP